MKLETDRLILRELTMNDVDALHEILSDPVSMQHYPQPFAREKTAGWIAWNLDNYKTYGFGLWAVVLKESNLFIGDCGITMQNIDGSLEPEIGYHINKIHTGQGYATEAARACRNYAFDVLGLSKVYSYMKHTNLASQKVAQKNDMKLLAKLPDEVNGITTVYAITLEEYLSLNK